MRILAGKFKGRALGRPSSTTRPAAARVREGVASHLATLDAIFDASVLDLFAGCGSYGFELLSRGARNVTLVETNPRALQSMRKTVRELDVSCPVVRLDLLRLPAPRVADRLKEVVAGPFTLLVMDPPYIQTAAALALLRPLIDGELLNHGARCVIEHSSRFSFELPADLVLQKTFKYGDTAITSAQVVRDE